MSKNGWTDWNAFVGLTLAGPRNHALDWFKVGWIHDSLLRGLTRRWGGPTENFFDHFVYVFWNKLWLLLLLIWCNCNCCCVCQCWDSLLVSHGGRDVWPTKTGAVLHWLAGEDSVANTVCRATSEHEVFVASSVYCPLYAPFGPGAIPSAILIPSLPHFSTFYSSLLVFFPFSLSYLLYLFFLLFHPFPFYQNTTTLFAGWI